MTDDELVAEVELMRQAGNRGEVEEVEGTPEGSYLWRVAHVEPPYSAVTAATMPIDVHVSYEISGASQVRPNLSTGAIPAPA